MSVLFIGKRYYTNRDALRERYGRIYQLPWYWARAGVNVRLWLIDYHGRIREARTDEDLQVQSTPIRGVHWMAVCLSIVFSRFRNKAPTHIIASGDAYIGLLAWLLAKFIGAEFVFDVYDKYDAFVGYRRPLGWDLFGFLLRHADRCWFASQRLVEEIGYVQRGDRVVANGVDLRHFYPRDHNEAINRLGLDPSIGYVGYFGSMEVDRGVDDLVEAIKLLSGAQRPVKLLLAGKKREGMQLDSVFVRDLGNLPFSEVPWALAACNVLAVPYRRSAFMDAGASNKIVEAIACQRPLAATATPNLVANLPLQAAELVNRLALPGNPRDLARVITAQLDSPVWCSLPDGYSWPDISASALYELFPLATPTSLKRSPL